MMRYMKKYCTCCNVNNETGLCALWSAHKINTSHMHWFSVHHFNKCLQASMKKFSFYLNWKNFFKPFLLLGFINKKRYYLLLDLLFSSIIWAPVFTDATTFPVALETFFDASCTCCRAWLDLLALTLDETTSWAVEAAISCEQTISCSSLPSPFTTLSAASLCKIVYGTWHVHYTFFLYLQTTGSGFILNHVAWLHEFTVWWNQNPCRKFTR